MKCSSKYTGLLFIGVVAIAFFCYEYFMYFPKQLTDALLLTMKSTEQYYTAQLEAEKQKAELQ